ncbi:unnamed protein product, partial [Rhizoctonia solani]
HEDLRAQGSVRNSGICDYLQDYRTGTILDVIGSVGGLFALLQAIHVALRRTIIMGTDRSNAHFSLWSGRQIELREVWKSLAKALSSYPH